MELKTGDLILFGGKRKYKSWLSYLSSFVKYTTSSFITHVGVILKDPTFLNKALKGTYVWESGWEGTPDPQDGKIKLGVQITPLEDIIKSSNELNISLLVRRINYSGDSPFNDTNLKEIHNVVYDKPYDIVPKDWIEALLRKDSYPQKIDRFWCSALVGYIYTKTGILKSDTDWSILRPSDFSLESEFLTINNEFSFEAYETKIN
jgi:hypothetical protein